MMSEVASKKYFTSADDTGTCRPERQDGMPGRLVKVILWRSLGYWSFGKKNVARKRRQTRIWKLNLEPDNRILGGTKGNHSTP